LRQKARNWSSNDGVRFFVDEAICREKLDVSGFEDDRELDWFRLAFQDDGVVFCFGLCTIFGGSLETLSGSER
jgi:hypothetical protein